MPGEVVQYPASPGNEVDLEPLIPTVDISRRKTRQKRKSAPIVSVLPRPAK